MITSKEVFAKRREGAVDEAYRMALELMGSPNADDWDRKAFCWCLIDIIKRDAGNGHDVDLAHALVFRQTSTAEDLAYRRSLFVRRPHAKVLRMLPRRGPVPIAGAALDSRPSIHETASSPVVLGVTQRSKFAVAH